ncbi:phage tail sheath C-terminal domain-containing protein [Oscillatoria sp. CS-180]|uniref:phage tail sheath family protein n=1 Tax=Oscillatoria sp. CS-180 TaxID=3021720 RepID=UPI00232C05D4|nr:phage tail sheath C-terminal domain-containing protein [Oscillatoria sp. CS-180]MDB9526514.1 phage tail sheath C-terminal domain-containing protein [Oscillatoria sp. CS-180]
MARLDYFAPGVYVEEVSRGSRAIQGINLSVAGFVGFTEDIRGDAELFEPILVTSWSQYLENFSKIGSDGFTDFGAYLPFAVKGWFENGGGRCWVVSIGTELPMPDTTPTHELDDAPPALTPVSTSGNKPSLRFALKPEKEAEGRVRVFIEPDEPLPPDNPDEEPFNSGEFFQVKVVPRDGDPEVFRYLTMQNPEGVSEEDQSAGIFVQEALSQSEYVNVELTAPEGMPLAQRPANGVYEVRPRPIPYRTKQWYREMYGSTKRRSGVQGLFEVDEVAMVACPDLMLVYQRGLLSLQQVHGVMEMMITNCETAAPGPAYRMAVIDPPPVKPRKSDLPVLPEQQKPQDIEAWRMDSFGRFSQFAALYYPWLQVPDPRSAGKPIAVPPCGHMMGLWCRTDESRGIHKAPANEIPRGVVGLAYDTNFREQEFLNPKGINCVRKFRNRGTLVWGARTLAQLDDTDWRYVSVRRLMCYIAKSIEEGTQWAVFEPNDEDLWARVTRTVKNFLERIWRQGALFGSTPEEAFYVKCDAELNTPETMKLGQLFVEIGVCPVRPAEFVIFRISQWDQSQDAA